MSTKLRFEKVSNRVYIARVEVSLSRRDSIGSYPARVSLRLDGRDGPFYRVDMMCLSPWEAIDGGREEAPRTLKEAKAVAEAYLAQVREQGTLHPSKPSGNLWD